MAPSYVLITGTDRQDFYKAAQSRVKAGYLPDGGVSTCSVLTTDHPDFPRSEVHYTQSFTKLGK
jgi:hypothetical protein